jgi:predicted amidohydrolase YtcJ
MKILHSARIHTQDSTRPAASAVVIEHGEILAVGGDELLQEAGRAQVEDMGGRVILPGLTDAHLHLKQYALSLQAIDCETESVDQCLQRVEQRAAATPAGKWILGHGWNQNVWGAWPTAAQLDRAAPDSPVYLTAKSLHAAWANSLALKRAGIQRDTPDPADGKIQRDQAGEPTGVLLESAVELVGSVVPAPQLTELTDLLEEAAAALWRLGITGVHDFDRRDCFMALQQLRTEQRLRLRVTKSIPVEMLEHAVELGLRTGFGDDWLRIGSVKAFMDGALGPRTAAMLQPYEEEPDNRGILNLDSEQLFEIGRRAAESGLGMAVHAIGDRANHEALEAFQQLRAFESDRGLPHLRHRIEHVQLLHPDDVPRLAGLDLIASMQPLHATSDMLMADRYWTDRTRYAYALKSQLESGAHLAFGSDAPVESPDPFRGIHAAVTRRRLDGTPHMEGWHPEQRLTVQQALDGYTTGPAYSAYAEGRQGRIAPGYLADLIVVDTDPFHCDPAQLGTVHTSATMIGGNWVYES